MRVRDLEGRLVLLAVEDLSEAEGPRQDPQVAVALVLRLGARVLGGVPDGGEGLDRGDELPEGDQIVSLLDDLLLVLLALRAVSSGLVREGRLLLPSILPLDDGHEAVELRLGSFVRNHVVED